MQSVDAYIYIFISLLGVAYPILLQVVARLEEKYSSDYIVKQFNEEWEKKFFEWILYLTFSVLVIWSLKSISIPMIKWDAKTIYSGVETKLTISTILLVVAFFFFVRKIMIYYDPSKLIKHLTVCNNNPEKEPNSFKALSELLLICIRQQKSTYTTVISDYFYNVFKKFREENPNQPVIYPSLYYDIAYKAIEELALLKDKRNYRLERSLSVEAWFLNYEQGYEISSDTYECMWHNLNLSVKHQQDDLIVHHWEACHQYYTYKLRKISLSNENSEQNQQVSNQETVEKRQNERQQFIEFHYALGGLLIYRERYACIRRLFSYTQSYPPKYELLPERMDEIFKFYFQLISPYNRHFERISYKYPFPELSGINADFIVKNSIMSYMGILFLRQYTLGSYLSTMRPLAYPITPRTQLDIKHWIDNLDSFEKLVTLHLENHALLKALNLDFITTEWCTKKGKPYPTTFIQSFKEKLNAAYLVNAENLPLSEDKVNTFMRSTKKIIEGAFEKLQNINNPTSIDDEDSDIWPVNGSKYIISKDPFSAESEGNHINYDSFLATNVADKLIGNLSLGFVEKTTESYLLNPEDIFKSLDKLNINNDYIIVSFGVNLDYCYSLIKKETLPNNYNGAKIVSFDGTFFVNDSIFILKECDLPNISSLEIPPATIAEYKLTPIDCNLNLYTSVIDLNTITPSSNIFTENSQGHTHERLRKSALLSIFLNVEYRWKKSIKVVKFQEYYRYSEKGVINKVGDVNPFDN